MRFGLASLLLVLVLACSSAEQAVEQLGVAVQDQPRELAEDEPNEAESPSAEVEAASSLDPANTEPIPPPITPRAVTRIRVPEGHERLGCGRHIARLPENAQMRTACGSIGTGFLPSGEGWVGGTGFAELRMGECRISLDLHEALVGDVEGEPLEVGAAIATPARVEQYTRALAGAVVLRTEHGSELNVRISTYDTECEPEVREVIAHLSESLSGLPLRTHAVAEVPLTTTGQTLIIEVPVQNVLLWRGHASDQYENSYELRSANGPERLMLYGHRGRPRAQPDEPSFESEVLDETMRFRWDYDLLMTADDEERRRHVAEVRTEDGEGTLVVALPQRTRLGARVMARARFGMREVPVIEP